MAKKNRGTQPQDSYSSDRGKPTQMGNSMHMYYNDKNVDTHLLNTRAKRMLGIEEG